MIIILDDGDVVVYEGEGDNGVSIGEWIEYVVEFMDVGCG